LHDHLGSGFTLLRLGGTRADTSNLQQAFGEMPAPLDVLDIACERAREIYEYDLLLIRPDLHVAWRGNKIPSDAAELSRIVAGHCAPAV